MMMGQDEVGSDQSTQIIKGKRTKRQRSSSFVVAATVTSTSSSAGGGGRAVSDEYNSAVSSPVSAECTEEEEDMAICLIMLARGVVPSPDLKNSRKNDKILHHKISSSFYVYECKTCNRTFPSFQALGGHRASHKKPRVSGEEKTRLPLMQPNSSGSVEGPNSLFKVSGSALASQASNMISTKASKVHECSICGSEFTSGQALGGHMRRHRTAATAVSPAAAAEVSRNSIEDENLSRSMEQRKYLPLDLNLPAPEDDLRESSKFHGIVFSATPALIDCHY